MDDRNYLKVPIQEVWRQLLTEVDASLAERQETHQEAVDASGR